MQPADPAGDGQIDRLGRPGQGGIDSDGLAAARTGPLKDLVHKGGGNRARTGQIEGNQLEQPQRRVLRFRIIQPVTSKATHRSGTAPGQNNGFRASAGTDSEGIGPPGLDPETGIQKLREHEGLIDLLRAQSCDPQLPHEAMVRTSGQAALISIKGVAHSVVAV